MCEFVPKVVDLIYHAMFYESKSGHQTYSLLKCNLKSPFDCILASKKHVLFVDVNTNIIDTNTTLINKNADINR